MQRIAKLVGEDREELVLPAVGLGHLVDLALHREGLEPSPLRDQFAFVRRLLRLAKLLGLVMELERALLKLDEAFAPLIQQADVLVRATDCVGSAVRDLRTMSRVFDELSP